MKKVVGVFSLVFIFVLVLNVISISAITGSIGNARMVLRAEVGDTIKKSILVKNVNNVSVNISMSVSGDLEKYVKLSENKFTLEAGEEKDVPFTIKVKTNGTSETKIHVGFSPAEGKGANVGLSSTIIVIAYGEGEIPEDETEDNENNPNDGFSDILGDVIDIDKQDKGSINYLTIVAITITIILIVSLIILLSIYKNKFQSKKLKKMGGKKR